VSKGFVERKLAEGAIVGPHVIKMVGYTQRLEKLGFPLSQELDTDFILASLQPSYANFISNYHMHGAEKGLTELCGMLKTAESDIKKSTSGGHVMAVQNKPAFKKKVLLGRRRRARLRLRTPSQTLHPRLNLDQLQIMSSFIIRRRDTGRGIASCTSPR